MPRRGRVRSQQRDPWTKTARPRCMRRRCTASARGVAGSRTTSRCGLSPARLGVVRQPTAVFLPWDQATSSWGSPRPNWKSVPGPSPWQPTPRGRVRSTATHPPRATLRPEASPSRHSRPGWAKSRAPTPSRPSTGGCWRARSPESLLPFAGMLKCSSIRYPLLSSIVREAGAETTSGYGGLHAIVTPPPSSVHVQIGPPASKHAQESVSQLSGKGTHLSAGRSDRARSTRSDHCT